jgi:hypothetical protein
MTHLIARLLCSIENGIKGSEVGSSKSRVLWKQSQ